MTETYTPDEKNQIKDDIIHHLTITFADDIDFLDRINRLAFATLGARRKEVETPQFQRRSAHKRNFYNQQ